MTRNRSYDQLFMRLRQLTPHGTEPVAEDFKQIAERRDDSVRRLEEHQQSRFVLQGLEPASYVVRPRLREYHDQDRIGRQPGRGDRGESRRWSRDGLDADPR